MFVYMGKAIGEMRSNLIVSKKVKFHDFLTLLAKPPPPPPPPKTQSLKHEAFQNTSSLELWTKMIRKRKEIKQPLFY